MDDLRLIGYWRNDDHPEYPDPHDLVDEAWDPTERHRVWAYLSSGTMRSAYMGHSPCRMCDAQNGALEFTDGVYVWPEGLGHYVYDHAVRLPTVVVDHAVARLDDLESRRVSRQWWLQQFGEDGPTT